MESGNLILKALVIEAGNNKNAGHNRNNDINDNFENRIQSIFNNLLHQLNEKKPHMCDSWFEGDSPKLHYLSANNNLPIIEKACNDAQIIFLIGDKYDIRFWQVRRLLSKNQTPLCGYPIVFNFCNGTMDRIAVSTSTLNEAHITCDDYQIPILIQDILAYELFPNFISCDWYDILSVIKGKTCKLVTFESNLNDFSGFHAFFHDNLALFQQTQGLVMLICTAKEQPFEFYGGLFKPFDELDISTSICWTDVLSPMPSGSFRVNLLVPC